MAEQKDLKIHVPVLARVEGEGALDLRVQDGQIEQLSLRIFEPPRYFEKFLEGRDCSEVVDIVARICGICPVAYQMSAVQAIEQVFACEPDAWVQAMRRVMYCGEWIESHALHIHLLAAPDFLGYASAPAMARDHADAVRRGLALQALGNELIALLGGRSVHPVGLRIGGFHRAPSHQQVATMLAKLHEALPQAEALVHWTARLPLPDDDQDFACVALGHPDEYPMNWGRLVSSDGLDIDIDAYLEHFEESHLPHSTALYSHYHGMPYLVGPLARLNLNLDRLPAPVHAVLRATDIAFPSRNMFHSIVARAAELYCAVVEAIRLLEDYEVRQPAFVDYVPRAGVGFGCTEAPRGSLWHRYELAEDGRVVSARIVPPTSQNQARIEEDLRASLQAYGLDHTDDALRQRAEMVVRNYDPCISCATHFLNLAVERS